MRKFLHILLAVIVLAGCDRKSKEPETDPEIQSATQVFLKVKGNTVFKYSEGNTQMTYNEKLREFRAGNDDMSSYFVITCSELPVREGQELRADIKWTSGGKEKPSTGINFKVVGYESTGLVRLWCASDKTGAVVRILK